MNEVDRKKFSDAYNDASPEAQEKIQAILREYGVTYRDLPEKDLEHAGNLIADILNLDRASRDSRKRSLTSMLRLLRENGWLVAVHNDYRQGKKLFTFWLFTNDAGYYLKGEAESDEDAVAMVYWKCFTS